MIIRGRDFDFDKNTYIMGILNATPDSFSDGGNFYLKENAIKHAKEMIEQGAHIIDIGGESTRPGFEAVSEEEEIERVVPVIEAIREFSDVVISVDTTKANVAYQSIMAGADIINDVSGFLLDEKMYEVAIKTNAPCVLMHDGNYFKEDSEQSYIDKLKRELCEIADKAIEKGVDKDKIILDPGVGFGKTVNENLLIIKHIDKLCKLNYPVLLGCSRKSVIGKTLDLPVNERLEGTITTSVLGAYLGCHIIRVHDVLENKRAVDMLNAIKYAKEQ